MFLQTNIKVRLDTYIYDNFIKTHWNDLKKSFHSSIESFLNRPEIIWYLSWLEFSNLHFFIVS